MIDLLFASNNKGKYMELVDDFKKNGINLIFDGYLNLSEEADTLRDNAIEKAKCAAKEKKMLAMSDDSGVFIEALDYFPGVHSRRWSGAAGDDDGRNEKILDMMKDEKNRTAYLISCFAIADKEGKEVGSTFVKNEFDVSYTAKGNYGFGYDKILVPGEDMLNKYVSHVGAYDTHDYEYIKATNFVDEIEENKKTIAELTQEEKNAVCNRGRIARDIKREIVNYLGADYTGD